MRKSLLAFAILAAGTLGSSPVAADMTFDVAVNVNNLAPEVNGVEVECRICSKVCEQGTNPAAGELRGTGRHAFPAGTAHNFTGRVTVLVRSRPPDEARATDYACTLYLVTPTNAVTVAGGRAGPAWSQPQPGTPFVGRLTGKLPKAASTTQPVTPPVTPPPPQLTSCPFNTGRPPACSCPPQMTGPDCDQVVIK